MPSISVRVDNINVAPSKWVLFLSLLSNQAKARIKKVLRVIVAMVLTSRGVV